MNGMTLHGASITIGEHTLPGTFDVQVEFTKPKVWDITPPFGWNWTSDDWRMYNFFRDLDSHGGVLSGELNDRYVLLRYNKKHPALSFIIFEDVPNGRVACIYCGHAIHIDDFAGMGWNGDKSGPFHGPCYLKHETAGLLGGVIKTPAGAILI